MRCREGLYRVGGVEKGGRDRVKVYMKWDLMFRFG